MEVVSGVTQRTCGSFSVGHSICGLGIKMKTCYLINACFVHVLIFFATELPGIHADFDLIE